MAIETAEKTSPPPAATNGEKPQIVMTNPALILASRFNVKGREPDEGLIESVRSHGIIQPLIVRTKDGTRLELIAGERRWKSATRLKLKQVPVIVRQATDTEVIELQTIENDQRKDLSPIEKAEKYQQLLDQYRKDGAKNKGEAVDRLCRKIGKKRSTVYEAAKLLQLPEPIKEDVRSGKLSGSQAILIARERDPDKQENLWNVSPGKSFRETKRISGRARRKLEPANLSVVQQAANVAKFVTEQEGRLGITWKNYLEPIYKVYRRRWQSGHAKKGKKR